MPLGARPTSYAATMFGSLSRAAALPSLKKRSMYSGSRANFGGSSLMATSRSRLSWRASTTVPIAPAPSLRTKR